MRQTPVNDYLEEISTKLPEELYGNLSDAIYETVCEFDEEAAQLQAENAKLVDVLHEVEQEAIHAYHCLQQDCVTIANSSEHFFKKWWRAECELDRAKAENAKLLEFVSDIWPSVKGDVRGMRMSAREFQKLRNRARELGIEVP